MLKNYAFHLQKHLNKTVQKFFTIYKYKQIFIPLFDCEKGQPGYKSSHREINQSSQKASVIQSQCEFNLIDRSKL